MQDMRKGEREKEEPYKDRVMKSMRKGVREREREREREQMRETVQRRWSHKKNEERNEREKERNRLKIGMRKESYKTDRVMRKMRNGGVERERQRGTI